MTVVTLADLQESVRDRQGFLALSDYATFAVAFLDLLEQLQFTKIISPTHHHYMFYQYGQSAGHKITRPLNSDLFITDTRIFRAAFDRFIVFLDDARQFQEAVSKRESVSSYLASNEIHKVIYTVQQAIGCIGDSFSDSNQSRKRIGQLFEKLVKLILQHIGLECEPRTIKIPIPEFEGYMMPYELDVVFSRNKAVITSESTPQYIYDHEIVGSVKTTSKDRLDKIFLDKYLLTKLLGRDIPVVAIFLHDVQRAKRGNSIFGVNSTFKTNHFLGYTVALNALDGVYYVDPRPEMRVNQRLREQIHDFQQFLVRDLWILSGKNGA